MQSGIWCLFGLSSVLACNTTLICGTVYQQMATLPVVLPAVIQDRLDYLNLTCIRALIQNPTQEYCSGHELCEEIVQHLLDLHSVPNLPKSVEIFIWTLRYFCYEFIPPFSNEMLIGSFFLAFIFVFIILQF